MTKKSHNIISIIIAIATLVVLQVFVLPFPIFRFLVPLRIFWIILITGYNYWYLKKTGKYNLWVLTRAILLFVGLFGVYSILPNAFLRGVFLIISVITICFFEIFLGNFSESVILNETLLMSFGLFMSLAAANWYFPKYEVIYTLVIFFSVFLLSRSVYEFVPQSVAAKNVASSLLALFCSEFFWVFTLLPFHYSIPGLLIFNLFYFCLVLNYYYFINTLSYKKIQLHAGLLAFTSFIILIATPWHILN